jgi:hypothetical protein
MAASTSHESTTPLSEVAAIREGRMHQLVRQQKTVRERTLEMTFLHSRAEAYSSRSSGSR